MHNIDLQREKGTGSCLVHEWKAYIVTVLYPPSGGGRTLPSPPSPLLAYNGALIAPALIACY